MKHLVFVYGTLKRGQGNNRVMTRDGGKAEFLGEFRTRELDYVMCGSGFPLVTKMRVPGSYQLARKVGAVAGELWCADDTALASMDQLEGHPSFYERQLVSIVPLKPEDGCKPTQAWMYLIPEGRYTTVDAAPVPADRIHRWR